MYNSPAACILHSTVVVKVVGVTLEEVSILGLIMYDRDVGIDTDIISSVFGMSVEGVC